MVGAQHFRNLEHQYTEADEATAGDDARVTFGRAVLEGTVTSSGDVVQRMPHHRLLSDVATLAANSLVKDAHVASDEFDVHVAVPDYEGPVQAMADVVLAQPDRYTVNAALRTPEGEVVAEASGVFEPSDESLSVEAPEETAGDLTTLPPAQFLSAFDTPVGMASMN
jgi:hypothetical protein